MRLHSSCHQRFQLAVQSKEQSHWLCVAEGKPTWGVLPHTAPPALRTVGPCRPLRTRAAGWSTAATPWTRRCWGSTRQVLAGAAVDLFGGGAAGPGADPSPRWNRFGSRWCQAPPLVSPFESSVHPHVHRSGLQHDPGLVLPPLSAALSRAFYALFAASACEHLSQPRFALPASISRNLVLPCLRASLTPHPQAVLSLSFRGGFVLHGPCGLPAAVPVFAMICCCGSRVAIAGCLTGLPSTGLIGHATAALPAAVPVCHVGRCATRTATAGCRPASPSPRLIGHDSCPPGQIVDHATAALPAAVPAFAMIGRHGYPLRP